MTTDPRTHGVGEGDVVDVVLRGRIRRVGQASMTLRVETAPHLSPGGVAAVEVWLPAEAIRAAVLAAKETM